MVQGALRDLHELDASLLRGVMAGAVWTARRAHARGLRVDAVCPYCATGAAEDEEHILWACPRWDEARGTHLADLEASLPQAPVLGLRSDWPPCLRLCGLLPERDYPDEHRDAVQGVAECLHAMMLAVLRARMRVDQQAPLLFGPRGLVRGLRGYPYGQLVGPLPRPPMGLRGLELSGISSSTWPWELLFLSELLSWLGELVWTDEVGTVTYLELAMDFEAHAGRALPSAPQAQFRGLSLPLQERGRVLRLALNHLQKLVVAGSLFPAGTLPKCGSLVPLGGPQLCGLNRRPYFTRREAMLHHVQELRD